MKNILLLFTLVCSLNVVAVDNSNYRNYYYEYTPKLTVLVGISKNDEAFKGGKTYSEFIRRIKEQTRILLKSTSLNLDLEVVEDADAQAYAKATHDFRNIGIIAINHGSREVGPFAGDIFDSTGASLFNSFNNVDSNIRAIAFVSCYSHSVVNSLKALDAFSPFTYLLSYSRLTFDVFDIVDASRSIIYHLKNTKNTWEKSRIVSLEEKVPVKVKRKCEGVNSQKLAELEIYFNSHLVKSVNSDECKEQFITFEVPKKLMFKNSISYVEFKKKYSNDQKEIGQIESNEKLNNLIPLKDSNGKILGGSLSNLYTFKNNL